MANKPKINKERMYRGRKEEKQQQPKTLSEEKKRKRKKKGEKKEEKKEDAKILLIRVHDTTHLAATTALRSSSRLHATYPT